MKAIILAAGMGTRLGKYTNHLPKGMLVFNGKTLIEFQLETLKKVGIYKIAIVTGYQKEAISYPGLKYYYNKYYLCMNHKTNSHTYLFSFYIYIYYINIDKI